MLFVGLRAVLRQADAMTPINSGRMATTDHWLAPLQLQDPSAVIKAVLGADVPTDQGVFVIGPDNDPQLTTIYFAISTLAWPRQVGLIRCLAGEPTIGVTIWLEGVSAGAALVWDPSTVNDPGAPDRSVGPLLRLVKGTEATQWLSYCSP